MMLLPLALSMTKRQFKLGTPLIVQGNVPQEMMIIIKGECQIVELRSPTVYSKRKEWSATSEKEFFAPPIMLSDLYQRPFSGLFPKVTEKQSASFKLDRMKKSSRPLKKGESLILKESWIQENHKEMIQKSQFDVISNIGVGEPLGLRALLTSSYKFSTQKVIPSWVTSRFHLQPIQ
jgi:hypothetical protein